MWIIHYSETTLSTLFLPLSIWCAWSMLFRVLSWQSRLLLDRSRCWWSKDILSLLLILLFFHWLFGGSCLRSVLCLGFSLLSTLFLRVGPSSLTPLLRRQGNLSTVVMNFLRCLMYSGYCSRSQWFPPSTQSGSYLSLHSSHSCFPWQQSTTSSEVPCTIHVYI